jgi:hypothetical protein
VYTHSWNQGHSHIAEEQYILKKKQEKEEEATREKK